MYYLPISTSTIASASGHCLVCGQCTLYTPPRPICLIAPNEMSRGITVHAHNLNYFGWIAIAPCAIICSAMSSNANPIRCKVHCTKARYQHKMQRNDIVNSHHAPKK